MIKNRNIIFFGEDWGRFPSTTQHIARIFLEGNRIMWIGSMGHRKPTLTLQDGKRLIEKFKNIFKGKKIKEESEVIKVHPFVIPLHDSKVVRKINARSIKKSIRLSMKENNFSKPIIISSSPLVGNILGSFDETSSHYFCLDDYSQFDGAFDSMIELENELLEKVSCCFAVSDTLVSSRKPKTGNSFFLPQGVSVEHFIINKDKIPERVKNLKTPVIGFFGLVSEWIDLNLIAHCAKSLPDFTFLIIGKPSVDISIFNECKNIIFIGEIPFNELPLYASAFNLGIIPFVVNELTVACNPLKLLEYLSLTIPVVSTNLPEVQKFNKSVSVVSSYDEFVDAIKFEIHNDSEEKRLARRKIAEEFSWHSIAENISSKIEKFEKESK